MSLLRDGWGSGAFRGPALVASAVAVPFVARAGAPGPRFGWISMVLVAEPERRRGLATRLTERCIGQLRAVGCMPVLDATPLGQAVYARMGFEPGATLDRWLAQTVIPPAVPACDAAIVKVGPDLDRAAIACDSGAFGAYRDLFLLPRLHARPDLAFAALREGRVVGLVAGRDGRHATQIGPLSADDEGVAATLIASALRECTGPAIVDLFRGHERVAAMLRASGFVPQRPFARMHLGDAPPGHDLARYFAMMGPEFG